MSLMSRLTSTVRSLARSPAVRRGARDLGRAAVRAVQEQRGGDGARGSGSHGADGGGGRGAGARAGGASGTATLPSSEGGALADRRGPLPALAYAPHDDDRPDPGEVVWAWVPYEEDLSRGKDRPVLVALMLTSRDRTESGATRTDEHGATWVDIGAGDWDRKGRPSEVRADRLLRLAPDAVRREGARLDRERFDRVAEAVRAAAA
jgi:hypothetical protein